MRAVFCGLLAAISVAGGWQHSGTLGGGASGAAPWVDGSSILFDGTNDFATAGTGPIDLTTNLHTTDFAAAAWIKPSSTATVTVAFSRCDLSGATNIHHMAGVTNTGAPYGYFGGVTNTSGAGGLVTAGTWHLLGITSVGGTGSVWLDAVHVSVGFDVASGTNTAAGVPFAIGACVQSDNVNFGRQFAGNIDEVGVWNAGFSQADWTALYNGGKPMNLYKHTRAGNLLRWYRMGDGDTYPTLLDIVSGKNATMTNMVAGDITTTVP